MLTLPPTSASSFDTIVLGAPNHPNPWVWDLEHPAVKTLRQDAQVLLREVLELSGSRSPAIVRSGNQTRLRKLRTRCGGGGRIIRIMQNE